MPSCLLQHSPATNSLKELAVSRFGTKTRVQTVKLPISPIPPNSNPVAKCPDILETRSVAPKYPDFNRTNEHKYYYTGEALFSRESTGTSRSLLPSPRTCLKVWTGSHRWQSPSRPPHPVAPAAGWSGGWSHTQQSPSIPRHGFSVPLSRTSSPSRWSSDSTLLHSGSFGLLCSRTRRWVDWYLRDLWIYRLVYQDKPWHWARANILNTITF